MTNNKLIIKVMLACFFVAAFQFVGASNAYAFCRSDSDCGPDRFVDEQFCQNNSLYQNYASYTCNNPGSNFSNCTASKSPQLIQTCNQSCEQGLWYIGCSATNKKSGSNNAQTCYSHSYQKCVGNSIYWFDSCNNQQDSSKTCPSNQTCQNNACATNYPATSYTTTNYDYISRAVKGCFKNTVYWYDSLGNQQDVKQYCNYPAQICQDGQCASNPNYIPVYKASETDNQKDETKTQVQNQDQSKSNITAAVSENPSIMDFVKKWYVWLIIILILIFLFVVIFRRISSNV